MITMKDIVREGHPILRKQAAAVSLPASKEDLKHLRSMMKFLKNSQDPKIAEAHELREGVGLAAPQIGVSKQMIAVHCLDEDENLHSNGYFNPRIVSHSVELSYLESGEGCLSVDREVPGYVPRYARIRVQATDFAGNQVLLRLRGYIAIVFQHEIDHLNGIMFYDRINAVNPFERPEGIAIE